MLRGQTGPVTISYRRATEHDTDGIRDVGLRVWPLTYGFAGDDYVASGLAQWWSDEAVRVSIASTTTWVAVDDEGRVVGIGNLDLRAETPTIWKLYVLPDTQGTGVGRALLEQLVSAVPPDRGRVILEYVDGNDRAATFYARQGFTEVEREPADHPGWPAIVWVERSLTP